MMITFTQAALLLSTLMQCGKKYPKVTLELCPASKVQMYIESNFLAINVLKHQNHQKK